MSNQLSFPGNPSRPELHHLLEEPGFDPAVIFAAFAFGQARVAAHHIRISVIPELTERERKPARLLLETIRRGGILQEGLVDDLEDLVQLIDPLIDAGTKEVPVWYADPDGDCDSCRVELRRTEAAEALIVAKFSIEALRDEIELTLDVIQANEAVDAVRNVAASRRGAMTHRPILFPESDD